MLSKWLAMFGSLSLVALCWSQQQTTGVLTFGNAWNQTNTADIDWVSPWEARFSNDLYTTAAIPMLDLETGAKYTERLRVGNVTASIPSDATINGLEVRIHRKASINTTGGRVRDDAVRFDKNGVLFGSNKAATGVFWPTVEGVAVYGGSADLWGTTWTPGDIGSTLGVQLRATNAGTSQTVTASVDFITVQVWYTPGQSEKNALLQSIYTTLGTGSVNGTMYTDSARWGGVLFGVVRAEVVLWSVVLLFVALVILRGSR